MFNALFQYNTWFATIALFSIILAAVYTLWMVQKIFLGEVINRGNDIQVPLNTKWMLGILVAVVLFFGVYPKPMINLTSDMGTIKVAQRK